MTKRKLLGILLFLCPFVAGLAQDAVPAEILQRTVMIRTATEQGTGFLIDYKGKLYMVTARHVLAGQPADKATIQVRRNGEWLSLPPSKILYPKSDEVDIAVLKTDGAVSKPFGIVPAAGTGGATMGQQVWFLGYPFLEGLSSHWKNGEAPFIKRGTMSAIVATNPDAVLLYIDGFNNEGFSGGPIVFWDFSDHVYKILGVVKGYKPEAAKVIINGQAINTNVLVDSGILVGYGIGYAIQAIENDAKQIK